MTMYLFLPEVSINEPEKLLQNFVISSLFKYKYPSDSEIVWRNPNDYLDLETILSKDVYIIDNNYVQQVLGYDEASELEHNVYSSDEKESALFKFVKRNFPELVGSLLCKLDFTVRYGLEVAAKYGMFYPSSNSEEIEKQILELSQETVNEELGRKVYEEFMDCNKRNQSIKVFLYYILEFTRKKVTK